MALLSLRDIHLGYEAGRPVLNGIDLSLASGEIIAVIGGSGAGKTSLLRVAAGLQPPDHGVVSVDGAAIAGPGADRAVVFQDDALFPWLTAADNVAFALRLRGIPRAERRTAAAHWLDRVGLGGLGTRRIWQLSGGQRQRVGIARALIAQPAFLLMDEPFGGLDALTRTQMQTLLVDIWRQTGKGILFITHDIEEALIIGTRLVVLAGGRSAADIPLAFGQRLAAGETARSIRLDPAFIALRERMTDRLAPAPSGIGDIP